MTFITKVNLINQDELAQLIADCHVVVVDYIASWCDSCKLMTPIIDRLATEYGDRVSVVKVDLDRSEENAAKYGIKSLPAILVFRDGKILAKLLGLQPYETLSNILETQLKP